MLYGRDRDDVRGFFCEVWNKERQGLPMEPLEHLVAEVARAHPEYHELLVDPEAALAHEADPQSGATNPFLHMGMHITIREQVGTDRPQGVADLYRTLVTRIGDTHAAEHIIMECLGRVLWEAQRAGVPPDEERYLECLRRLISRGRP